MFLLSVVATINLLSLLSCSMDKSYWREIHPIVPNERQLDFLRVGVRQQVQDHIAREGNKWTPMMAKLFTPSLIAKYAVDACRPILAMRTFDTVTKDAAGFLAFVATGMSNIIAGRLDEHVMEEGIEYIPMGSNGKGDKGNVIVAICKCDTDLEPTWVRFGAGFDENIDKPGKVMGIKTSIPDAHFMHLAVHLGLVEIKLAKDLNEGINLAAVQGTVQFRHGDTVLIVHISGAAMQVIIGGLEEITWSRGGEGDPEIPILELNGKRRSTNTTYDLGRPIGNQTQKVVQPTQKSEADIQSYKRKITANKLTYEEDLKAFEANREEWERYDEEKARRGGRPKKPEQPRQHDPPVKPQDPPAPVEVYELARPHPVSTPRASLSCSTSTSPLQYYVIMHAVLCNSHLSAIKFHA